MAIQWTNDLATGVQTIDDRDKELFSRVNLLFNACNMAKAGLRSERPSSFSKTTSTSTSVRKNGM